MADQDDRAHSDMTRSDVSDKYLADYGDDYKKSRFQTNMRRDISWVGAFFVAAGVPALVLFSMGAISAAIGPVAAWCGRSPSCSASSNPSSMPRSPACIRSKSGGTAVHGATAWIRYSQFLAPLSLWCNWLAWTPVLAIGSGLGAGYLLSIFYAAGCRHQHLADDARRSRLPQGRADAAHQRHVHHRRRHHAGRVHDPASRHPAHGAHPDYPDDRRRCCRSSSSASCRC